MTKLSNDGRYVAGEQRAEEVLRQSKPDREWLAGEIARIAGVVARPESDLERVFGAGMLARYALALAAEPESPGDSPEETFI